MLPVLPIIVLGIAATVLGIGCSSSKKEEQQKTPAPSDIASTDHPPDAIDCFWMGDRSKAHLEKWNPATLIHFNAAARLCSTLDRQRGTQGAADFYRQQIVDFFEQPQQRMSEAESIERHRLGHRAPPLRQGENGTLVLIAGLAPAEIPEEKMLAVFDDLRSREPHESSYLDLFKACYYYNKAVERSFNRWTEPYGAVRIPLPCIPSPTCSGYASGKVQAQAFLNKMKSALAHFASADNNTRFPELTLQEQGLLNFLKQESARYEMTLNP